MSAESSYESTAAAVSYRPHAGDGDISRTVEDPAAVSVDYFDLTSLDGNEGIAGLFRPAAPADGAPLVLSVHGSGGSLFKDPIWPFATGLAARGVPTLAVNTRQHDDAVNTDHFFASVRDIEAGYWLARSLGYDRIVLHGHSLGSVQMSYFAASYWYPEIVGVMLTGMPARLPWKSRYILIGDEELYGTFEREATAAMRAGDFFRVLGPGMPWINDIVTPTTAAHFASYRDSRLAAPNSVDWVARVPYPILMVRDEHDTVILPFEATWMAAAAREGLSPSVTAVALSSEAGSNGHLFQTSMPQLVETAAEWLASGALAREA